MFPRLLLIFIIVPLIELYLIIEVSSRIGLAETLLTLIVISVVGAALAKREGSNAVQRVRQELAAGRMPGDSLIEGALVLAGAVLLLTPGFLTDALGLALLIPPTRKAVLVLAKRRLQKSIRNGSVRVYTSGPRGQGPGPEQRRRELED